MAKKANPLYAVTNKGKDIEEVSDYFELLVAKLGLTPVIEFFESLLSFLLDQISSYAGFVAMKAFLDDIVIKLESLFSQVDPVWASLFPAALEGMFEDVQVTIFGKKIL
jgi:hypothetical protein